MQIRTVGELEQIVERSAGSSETAAEIYEALEELESGDAVISNTYQAILEAIVYDILKTPKK